jgi:signal transduction histidine kinase
MLERERAGRPVHVLPIDRGWVRSRVLAHFQDIERDSDEEKRPSLRSRYGEWTRNDRDLVFAEELASELEDRSNVPPSPEELWTKLDVLIALQLKRNVEIGTLTERWELQQIAEAAWKRAESASRVLAYAAEISAIRILKDQTRVTPIGRIYAELKGKDALRWLLLVELEQSTGSEDPWRLSREDAQTLIKRPAQVIDYGSPEAFWMSLPMREHLAALGVLSIWDDDEAERVGYDVSVTMLALLEDVVAGSPESPLPSLAKTLVADETISLLPAPGTATARFDTGAIAASRQARSVAHELRNALVPAKLAHESMSNALRARGIEDLLEQYGPRIERGYIRAFNYVETLLRTAEIASQPPAPFRLLAALRDAIAEVNGGSVELDAKIDDEATISGYRERFVVAVINLLRNARQTDAQTIRVSVLREARDIVVYVDDDGPGIEAANREQIFRAGVSFREGGTGYGLAEVKETIEREHGGAIDCTTSPLGGARFIVRLIGAAK